MRGGDSQLKKANEYIASSLDLADTIVKGITPPLYYDNKYLIYSVIEFVSLLDYKRYSRTSTITATFFVTADDP